MNMIKNKLLSVITLICILSTVFAFPVSASLSEGTAFEAILSGEKYGVKGEKFVLYLEITNFAEEEFLGASCNIDYDASVLEISDKFFDIINGNSTISPFVTTEDGWVFWGSDNITDNKGVFSAHILNDSSDIVSLKGDSIKFFIEFTVKSNAVLGETVLKIDTDEQLVGVFSESDIASFKGTGSSLTVDICDEIPTPPSLLIKSDAKITRKLSEYGGFDMIKGMKEKTSVDTFLSYFENDADTLRVVKDGVSLSGTDNVTSGSYVQLVINGEVIESVMLIVIGDVDCSGNLNTTDYIQMRRYFVDETYSLSDSSYISADIEENGKLNATDYVLLKAYFMGITDIYE